ncbi:hypothetical protein SARC_01247 [Sphaeroforma arctica JP610]|uniref:Aminoglycoside phosphotransferase domain-containing protein n=1 Tax=Sphaeroforma arctica JP610 TaxID=667725 RepID=A0A0L0GEF5_9EUKA|nr:hypothetical protein SARC_01247 [Sphaeroforma arctica JP610]KNC86618.1 hypothetical protein SARC_01247 [Sphaeroforma arctica JP610]|eukprot:XP_014160520.1 hypothetical protein SARC_01247 [Sphaeroforma arctica JP610]
MESLRSSVIHNDANDHNVIVSVDSEELPIDPATRLCAAPQIVGVIDFGDVLLTKTVFNPAITIAYSILEADEPVSAGVSLIQGYTAQFPLQDTELSLLFLLTMCRLAQSVVYSTIKMLDYPDDEYIPIAQRPAWRVLESLWGRRAEVSAAWVAAAVRPDTPHLDKQ